MFSVRPWEIDRLRPVELTQMHAYLARLAGPAPDAEDAG